MSWLLLLHNALVVAGTEVFQTRLNGKPQFFIVLGGKVGLNGQKRTETCFPKKNTKSSTLTQLDG